MLYTSTIRIRDFKLKQSFFVALYSLQYFELV